MLGKVVIALITAYQRSLGRLMPPRCRFHPSCSVYAVGAIRARGALIGSALALWRILRCGPWTSGGIDHPPQKKSRAGLDGSRREVAGV